MHPYTKQTLDSRIIQGMGIKEYQAIHYWLKKNFGRADKCENPECLGWCKKYQWALKKGMKYKRDKGHFQMLCRSCHSKLDITEDGRKRLSKSAKTQNRHIKTITCANCNKEVKEAHISAIYCRDCAGKIVYKTMAQSHEGWWKDYYGRNKAKFAAYAKKKALKRKALKALKITGNE